MKYILLLLGVASLGVSYAQRPGIPRPGVPIYTAPTATDLGSYGYGASSATSSTPSNPSNEAQMRQYERDAAELQRVQQQQAQLENAYQTFQERQVLPEPVIQYDFPSLEHHATAAPFHQAYTLLAAMVDGNSPFA